jgi:serine/threonine protein kinase
VGRGGFSRAYRARRVTGAQSEIVCLKIPIGRAGTREAQEEARLLRAIHSDAVVRFIECVELGDGRVALALELIEGSTLADLDPERSRTAPLSANAVAYVGKRLCDALCAANCAISGGLVHRDVSPHNVLVSRAGDVKLADFGVARAWDRNAWTDARCIKGKLSYASPEQLLGAALDARSDLFALGVILFQLCTGKHPFGQGSPRDKARGILVAAPPQAPPVDAHVSSCIMSLIQRCPDERPASPAHAAERLGKLTDAVLARAELARRVSMLRPGLASCRAQVQALTTRSFERCAVV